MITLFSHGKHDKPAPDDELVTSGSGTAQLSVAAVENDFVAGVYEKLASVYDLAFGPALQPGRVRALAADGHPAGRARARSRRRHRHQPVALSHGRARSPASTSRSRCSRRRAIAWRAGGLRQRMRLLQMDAADLKFADDSFDIVYAPYLISVVPGSGEGGARDAPRLPARRPHHLPQSLPQPERAGVPRSSG